MEEREKRLKSEKLLLKRALLAEKEAAAAGRAELQRKDGELRELLGRADALADDKARLAAKVAQLQGELEAERRIGAAQVTGGSMFNTLLSSADGSAAEIDRLQRQVALTEEELANQIKNTGKVHQDMHQMKKAHEAECARLRLQTRQAFEEVARLEEQAEQARADARFANQERQELQTQLESKAALVDDLNRKLRSKTEALAYVEQLRESDLQALQQKFDEKVPFDDTKHLGVFRRYVPVADLVAKAEREQRLEDAVMTELQAISATGLALVSELAKEEGPAQPARAFCSSMQQLCGAASRWFGARKRPRASMETARPAHVPSLREAGTDAVRHAKELCSTLFVPSVATSLEDQWNAVLDLCQGSSSPLGADKRDAWVDKLSSLGAVLEALQGTDVDDDGSSSAMLHFRALGQSVGALARSLHEHSADSGGSLKGSATKLFLRRVRAAASAGVRGPEKRVVSASHEFKSLESKYDDALVQLREKERLLSRFSGRLPPSPSAASSDASCADSQNGAQLFVDASLPDKDELDGAASLTVSIPGSYNVAVVAGKQGTAGELVALADVFPRKPLGSAKDLSGNGLQEKLQQELRTASGQVRAADARAVQLAKELASASRRGEDLELTKVALEARLRDLETKLEENMAAGKQDLEHVRKSYDVQLQRLTTEMMRLQDIEQEQEAELKVLRGKPNPF
ncbi:Hypothetical protein SCF082_LOCUS4537 [Durusdinium trenchii]|uniref:Coiled-coil domain-containing protein 128 n=1 Tax=Durusdinium trenchii TaxID=1381693 RepID=A0ABP0HZY7_9DINO